MNWIQRYVKKGLLSFAVLGMIGCGTNAFDTLDPSKPGITATKMLEEKKPDQAIEVLLDELGAEYRSLYGAIDSSSDQSVVQSDLSSELATIVAAGKVENPYYLVSILSSAHAQKHGVDPFELGLKLASNGSSGDSDEEGSSDGEANPVLLLFPVLPDATAENILGVDTSLTILRSVGRSNMSNSDSYKEALFLAASISIVTKALDKNGDGEISPIEAFSMSDDSAASVLNQLDAAIAAAATSDGSSEEAGASSEQISKIKSLISAEEGDDDAEKLRAFVSSSQGSEE